jgi:hypothetical protein
MWNYFDEPPERAEKQEWRSVAQLFISQTEDYTPETQMVNVRNSDDRAFCTKPMNGTGLWTSTYLPDWNYPSEWVEWCMGEKFGNPYGGTWWLLTPRSDARIFVTETQRDLQHLMKAYPYPSKYAGLHMTMIDFEAMSKDYDGMWLTSEGNARLHLSHPYNLNSWDVESTLWFRWCFVSAKKIETPAQPQVLEESDV